MTAEALAAAWVVLMETTVERLAPAMDALATAAHVCAESVGEMADAFRRFNVPIDRVRRYRHPGAWSDKTRAKRARRLAKAAARRLREQDIRADVIRAPRRAWRRKTTRLILEDRAAERGLTPMPGEFTKALRARLVDHMRNPPSMGARATEGAES